MTFSPRTWVVGETVTAAQLNTEIRDQINSLSWVPYTPTLTNVTLGNGNVVAEYCQQGDLVDVSIILNWGSTTSMSGTPAFSIPVTPRNNNMRWVGDVLISPPGTFRDGVAWLYWNGTTIAAGAVDPVAGGVGTFPAAGITMASGGWIAINIRYRST
ncbi:hypothetical protein [Streptomyces sp. NPDC047939]|uniref:hypothetical protein n=1 Tax=Streptomyces sp. NPDC047939 TaxID=3155381 RepID=UPI003425BD39